jgi:alkylation response protein AidB-like acyl-CoA dehydrogenase
LPALAVGDALAAFALTEPGAGSDAAAVATQARKHRGDFVLDGQKLWISFGQIADLFLVVARAEDGLCAFLVDREAPGLTVRPRAGLLGIRASMLADLSLVDCRIQKDRLIGGPSLGLAGVVATALELGRYSIAWGCVGIARTALRESVRHARQRRQFGVPIGDHQLVRCLLGGIANRVEAARLMCARAGRLKNENDLDSVVATLQAKLIASKAATRATADAVQIHGARGCCDDTSIERLFRDARVMEIIEGSTQVIESLIGEYMMEHHAL